MPYKEQIKEYIPINDQEAGDQRVMLDYIEQFPKTILTRENEFAHLTSSGFVINQKADKVLMIHHNIYGTWAWTGGHADGDRDMLAVAIKEAQEETGVDELRPLTGKVDAMDILPVWGHWKKGKYVPVHLHLNVAYILIADEEAMLKVNEAETSGVKWIAVEDIPNHCSEPDIVVIYNKLLAKARRILNH
ncbi:MAG: NUDIX hydrolase [Cellulosilyticaceae bacterium]